MDLTQNLSSSCIYLVVMAMALINTSVHKEEDATWNSLFCLSISAVLVKQRVY